MFSFVNPLSLWPVIEYYEDLLDYEQNDTLPADEEKFYYSVYTTHDQVCLWKLDYLLGLL